MSQIKTITVYKTNQIQTYSHKTHPIRSQPLKYYMYANTHGRELL